MPQFLFLPTFQGQPDAVTLDTIYERNRGFSPTATRFVRPPSTERLVVLNGVGAGGHRIFMSLESGNYTATLLKDGRIQSNGVVASLDWHSCPESEIPVQFLLRSSHESGRPNYGTEPCTELR